jgi:hypothetical protein
VRNEKLNGVLFLYVVSILYDLVLVLSSVRHPSGNLFSFGSVTTFPSALNFHYEGISRTENLEVGNFGRQLVCINKKN